MLYVILKILLYIPFKIFFPTRTINQKKIPKKKGCIILCNHFSAWDIPILGFNIRRNMHFVGKKELFKNKFLGGLFKWMNASPIDRHNMNMSSIKTIIKKLKQGKAVALFPEGTRKRTDDENTFEALKNGASMFAIMSGTPIVPVLLKLRPKLFRPNTLTVGDPIDLREILGSKTDKNTLAQASVIMKEGFLKLTGSAVDKS